MRKSTWRTFAAAAIVAIAGAGPAAFADEIEVPAWTPVPPVSTGPALPAVADRFVPTDVAAAPPPGGLFAPAPPAFDRFSCDTYSCGGGRSGPSLGVIESPVSPGELPGLGGVD